MNEKNELTYRLYVLSIRQLSGINKGCQGIHAALEYSEKYFIDPEYRKYIEKDKTLVMIDGGTNQDMIKILDQLEEGNIHHTYFTEPDLNDCVTSIAFIADERVWDKAYSKENFVLVECDEDEQFNEWVESIGGPKNLLLRNIIQGKRRSL